MNALGSVPTSVSIVGTSGANALSFTSAALAPTAQTLGVSLSNVTGGAGLTLSAVSGTNSLEQVSIVSNGAVRNNLGNLTTTGLGVTTLTVTGSQALTATVVDANNTLRTVNASGSTGNNNLTLLANSTVTGGSGDDTLVAGAGGFQNSFTGGAGNDTFDFRAGITATDTVAGGLGTDTLILTNANAAVTAANAYTNISGIETLTESTANAGTVVLSRINSGINTVNLGSIAAAAQGGTVTFDGGFAGTINVGAAVVASSLAAFTVTAAGTATTDAVTINNNGMATALLTGALTATGVETLTLNGTATATANQAAAVGALTITPTTGGTSKLVLTGNNQFDFSGNVANIITATQIDASGLAAVSVNGTVPNLVMNNVANTATSITGSLGADTLFIGTATATYVDGGAGADTISEGVGGAGNDTILGGAGADTITAGAGTDNIDAGADNDLVTLGANLSAGDTVNGGTGVDTLNVSAAVTAATGVGVSNFEIFRASGGANLTQDMAIIGAANAITTIQDNLTAAGGFDLVINNAAATTNALNLISLGGAGDDITFSRLIDSATDTLSITRDSAAIAQTFGAVTLNHENTININTTAAGATALTFGTLNAVEATAINVTGSGNLVATVGASGAAAGFGVTGNIVTIDASANTGTVNFNAGATTLASGVKVNLTGSTTAVNTLVGGANADTITGGAAGDNIAGGAGLDVLNGGAGADNFIYTAANQGGNAALIGGNVLTAGDSISGFVSTSDKIDVSAIGAVHLAADVAAAAWNLGTNNAITLNAVTLDFQAGVTTSAQVAAVIGSVTSAGDINGFVAIFDNQGTASTADDVWNIFDVALTGAHAGAAIGSNAADTISLVGTVNSATFVFGDFTA